MSGSYRIIIAALGLICLTTLGQAQEQASEPKRETATQQQPAQTLPIPLPVDIVEDKTTAEARERHEAEARQREKEDLVAQQGMNRATQAMNEATQRMADYAYWSTGLVGFGTFLLVITLWLTRQANKAAQAAVEVTRDIGEKQVRAYLYCKSAEYRFEKETLVAILELENTGQSPARNVTATAKAEIHEVALRPDFPKLMSVAASEEVTMKLQPIPVGGKTTEEIPFLRDYNFPEQTGMNTYAGSVESAFEAGNGMAFDIVVKWADVFDQTQHFELELSAMISPEDDRKRERKAPTGALDTRRDDTRFGAYLEEARKK